MNTSVFTGSTIEEDPQNFINEIWRILKVMHATETDSRMLQMYDMISGRKVTVRMLLQQSEIALRKHI